MRETTTLPQYSGLAILLIIHECFRDRPSLGQRKLQVSAKTYSSSRHSRQRKKGKRKRSIHFLIEIHLRLKIIILYGRIKIFVVYASINFKDLEGRSTDSNFFCTKTIPFPLSFSLFFFYLPYTPVNGYRVHEI